MEPHPFVTRLNNLWIGLNNKLNTLLCYKNILRARFFYAIKSIQAKSLKVDRNLILLELC